MPLPDLIEIVPLDKPVRAEITVPGSKSITNRALILAALADGEVTLEGALWSEDTQVMTEALRKLGFEIKVELDPEEFCNRRITVTGLGGKIPQAGTPEKPLELFVGNAGTAARFLAAMVCLGNGVYRLSGVARMHERPQAALFKALRELGYRVDSANDKLPAIIFGSSRGNEAQTDTTGQSLLTSAATRHCTVSIEESSQFASALLLCAKQGGWDVKVAGENAEESPYVAMTTKLIEAFPIRGGKFLIEPDASSGSYFWAAALLSPRLPSKTDLPADFVKRVVTFASQNPGEVCHRFGGCESPLSIIHAQAALLRRQDPSLASNLDELISAQSWIWVQKWPTTDWQIDSRLPSYLNWKQMPPAISRRADLGDSIMTFISVTPLSPAFVTFTDLGRLRVQECERVVALRTELTKCGAKVLEEGDTLTVYPSKLHGAEIETYNDHRMAMCFAILGLKVPGIKIKNPACVKKTFPNFFQKLASPPPKGLGATILDAKTGRKLEVDELFAE